MKLHTPVSVRQHLTVCKLQNNTQTGATAPCMVFAVFIY
jgi:hypothetical protein